MSAKIFPPPSPGCESEDDPTSDLTDSESSDSDSGSAPEVELRRSGDPWSVTNGMINLMLSFEWANLKLKDKSKYGRLQIYGEIELITWGGPVYLYRRSEAEAETLTPSPENDGEGFNFPLSVPDWSLSATHITALRIALYEKGGRPLVSETFNLIRSVKGNIIRAGDWDKNHEPIYKVIHNDRATFTLCFTRILHGYNVFVSFRAINSADDTDYNGEWAVSGTIRAAHTFSNGVSRMLTLFHSKSEVKVPPGRSIPLVRPVVIAPVNSEKAVKAGEGGFVKFDFDLNLKIDARADDNILRGEATLELGPDHKREHPFYLTINDGNHNRKFSSNDGGLKIKIMITPFHEYFRVFNNYTIKEWAL